MTTTTRTRTTTTTRTMMTTKMMLLLCVALLTSKFGANAAPADAWSETTTVGEGSGWEVTVISTDQPELTTLLEEQLDTTTNAAELTTPDGAETTVPETTLSPNEPEPEPETTLPPNEEPSTAGPGEAQSTAGPGEEQSSAGPSDQSSTSSPVEESSSAGPGGEQSSAGPSDPSSTSSPVEESSSAGPSDQSSTSSPGEQPATSSPGEESSSAGPSDQSSTASPGEESSSAGPGEESSSAGPGEQSTTTTEEEPAVTTLAPTPPAPPVFECQTVGLFAHIGGDCQRYHNCLRNPFTGELLSYDMLCPPRTAFSPTYKRCLRDVAACTGDGFECTSPGRFAGSDDSYYYTCIGGLQGGFHKYIVRCSAGQRFEPLLGRCWRYDWTQLYPGQALEASDLAAIKLEQKLFKAEEKQRKKLEKNQEKQLLKQQKLEEKLAKKAAKEQAKKAAKEQAKANKPLSLESVESPEQPED